MYYIVVNKTNEYDSFIVYINDNNKLIIYNLINNNIIELININFNNIAIYGKNKNGISYLSNFKDVELLKINNNNLLKNLRLTYPINSLNLSRTHENIYVYHRIYKLIFKEYITNSTFEALNIIYDKIKSKIIHDNIIEPSIIYLTKLIGYYYN